MRHARAEALAALEELLDGVRALHVLQERTPGSFYYKRAGFLHFHEDPAGLFADVKLDGRHFERLEVTSLEQQYELLALIQACLVRSPA